MIQGSKRRVVCYGPSDCGLRASTKEQDARRAKGDLESFAKEKGVTIAAFYTENESGASHNQLEEDVVEWEATLSDDGND